MIKPNSILLFSLLVFSPSLYAMSFDTDAYQAVEFANPHLNAELNTPEGNLRKATLEGDFNKVRALLEAKASVNAQDFHGTTALMIAAASRHMQIFNLLLERGARVDIQQGKWGATILTQNALILHPGSSDFDERMHICKRCISLTLASQDQDKKQSLLAQINKTLNPKVKQQLLDYMEEQTKK